MDTFHRLAGVSTDTPDGHDAAEAPQPAVVSQQQQQQYPPPPPIPETDDITARNNSLHHSTSRRSSRASIPINRQPSQKSLRRGAGRRNGNGNNNAAGEPSTPTNPPNQGSGQQGDEDDDDGEGEDEDEDFTWGPTHPCYPHPNPHVHPSSPLYTSTRVIRVKRDWLAAGDLYPQYANLYPEILDPVVSDAEFRLLVSTVNARLKEALDPFSTRAKVDVVMGVATGFLWESLGFAGVKRGLKGLEGWLWGWNEEMRRQGRAVRVVFVRRTGGMSLDFVVPDPGIGEVGVDGDGDGGDGEPVSSGGIGPAE